MTDIQAMPFDRAERVDDRRGAEPYWWVFLVLGGFWLAFALLVFQLDATSIDGVSTLIGIVCLAAAAAEVTNARANSSGRVVHALLTVAFIVIALLAFIHPENTFSALASIFAFYLLIRGVVDVGVAIAGRGVDLWWVGLVTGVIEILLAFWAAGDFGHKTILLVIWVGASALLVGLRQIVFAFQLRSERPA